MNTESVEELVKGGYSLLERGEVLGAMKVGGRLRRMRHILGYEIEAMALYQMGKIEKAVNILQKAVILKPLIWRLWQLLGNYRSDLGMYGESVEAYKKALACPDVDRSTVQYNLSIVFNREGKHAEAMGALNAVTDASFDLRVKTQRLAILNNMERFREVISLGEAFVYEATDEASTEWLANIGVSLAWAYWHGLGDGKSALRLARAAIVKDHSLITALWLIRQIEGLTSSANKLYRLLVDGDWPWPKEDGTLLGFLISYDVIAESPEKAMEFVRHCEEEDVARSLTTDKCEVIRSCPIEPAGVCAIGKYSLYSQGMP